MELLMIEGKILKDRKYSWDNNRGQKGRDKFSPYRGPDHGLLSNLSKSPREILAIEKAARSFEQPPRMFGSKGSRGMSKYCHFHEDHGHDTNDCRQLRNQIEEAVKSGQLSHLMKGIKKERDESYTKNKFEYLTFESKEITFPSGGEKSWSIGKIPLEITIGDTPLTRKETLDFVIVKSNLPYNMLLGRKTMQKMEIVVSTIYGAIKFHTTRGIGMVFSTHESDNIKEGMKKNARATYQRLVDKVFHDQIGINLEAYVDDMVIKSTSEEEMLADIKETFEKF
ncbi:hypothetical protein Tco_0833588 [Tanacetum coccineum]